MAKTIWDPQDRAALLARADSLTPATRPQWGKMSVTQMLRHCTVPILATMGEFQVTHKKTPFRFWPLRPLIDCSEAKAKSSVGMNRSAEVFARFIASGHTRQRRLRFSRVRSHRSSCTAKISP